MPCATNLLPIEREFIVACFCAEWCGTCREYQEGFDKLVAQFPDVGFFWVDIENTELKIADWDVENFPSILIQRSDMVLFWGPMLPHHQILAQTLASLMGQGIEEAKRYASSTPERSKWQLENNFRQVTVVG